MAFGGLEKKQTAAPMAEINMTPLIDVMLVLLVIFIITAPLFTHAIRLDLPKVASAPARQTPQTIALSIDAAGKLYWNGGVHVRPIARATCAGGQRVGSGGNPFAGGARHALRRDRTGDERCAAGGRRALGVRDGPAAAGRFGGCADDALAVWSPWVCLTEKKARRDVSSPSRSHLISRYHNKTSETPGEARRVRRSELVADLCTDTHVARRSRRDRTIDQPLAVTRAVGCTDTQRRAALVRTRARGHHRFAGG